MRNLKATLTALVAGAAILAASPASARVWGAPSGWTVTDTDDGEACGFSRDFEGTGATRVIVVQEADGDISLGVGNYEWDSLKEGTSVPVSLRLGKHVYDADASIWKDGIYRGLMFSLREEHLQAFAEAPFLTIYRKGSDTIIDDLKLDGTGAAVALLKRCLVPARAARARRLADEARLAHIPKDPFAPPAKPSQPGQPLPKANIVSLFSDADYPASAVRAGEQGRTAYRLTVGPDGRVTDCAITSSSGSATLDSATCRLIRLRARFTPVRGSDGSPQASSFEGAISWRLPDDPPPTTVTQPPGSPERGD